MRAEEYHKLASFEETYWWFIVKRRLVEQCITRYAPDIQAGGLVVDVGCGTGATLGRLQVLTPLAFGVDYSAEALKYCLPPHRGRIGQANVLSLPFKDDSLTLVTILDVLYHQFVTDDEVALRELYRTMAPGGVLILTAPAFQFLSGNHDKSNLTARRYTLSKMHNKLTRIGFKIKKESYIYALLFPVMFVRRFWQRLFTPAALPASDIQELPFRLNQTLQSLFQLELQWLKIADLPLGTSILFVAVK